VSVIADHLEAALRPLRAEAAATAAAIAAKKASCATIA
jgi:hypothetical protein